MPTMPLEMTRASIARDSMIGPVGAEETAKREGIYQGRSPESVSTSTKSNVLSQAKHDSLTHALDTNFKTLAQRSVRHGQAATQTAATKIADFYDKIVDQLPNMPPEETIHRLFEALHQLAEREEVHGDE